MRTLEERAEARAKDALLHSESISERVLARDVLALTEQLRHFDGAPLRAAYDASNELAEVKAQLAKVTEERDRLRALINTPEIESFLRAVHVEAVHQIERWGEAHDRAKEPADWMWLLGYLAGKALSAHVRGDREKALHHTISSAAVLYQWHCAIDDTDLRTCDKKSDLAQAVDAVFPGASEVEGGAT